MNELGQNNDFHEQRRGAIGVVCKGDQLLVIRRAEHIRAGGKICFPGGSVEPGETIEAAVVRELREELDLDVRPLRELWQCTIRSGTRLHWWLVELSANSVVQPDPNEVDTFAWLKINQIKRLKDLLPSNADFFVAYEAGEFELPLDE